ncbi:MAG TPA: MazG-like family protein [Defluviitaleaceae bacterium]|jgi:hypothetical protein|nr:hypothetical protein [Candidatus Epulonipiscium sp.]HPT76293.1 MazG-like family protein [Defluviitaleaceae bacterium]HQD50673.1 MazG-like family protein [Defluviitaleaceae bacterium]
MGIREREFDITRSLKIVEKLKSQMLCDIAQLFSEMVECNEESHEERADLLANIIILTYLLSKRLGISYNTLDMKIYNKLKLGILENMDEQEWFTDLTALMRHLEATHDSRRSQ